MPVRIYEIAKRLNLANKEVLDKAKVLGIQHAKVASSSLDKITAEFLEQEILKELKPSAAPVVEAPKPVELRPVIIIAPPEPEPAPPPPEPEPLPPEEFLEPVLAEATAAEIVVPEVPAPPASPTSAVASPATTPPAAAMPVAAAPAAPAPPRVGEKVGFIDLGGFGKRPPRRDEPRRDPPRRTDIRPDPRAPQRSDRPTPTGPGGAVARPAARPTPTEPRILLPADAKIISIKPPIVVRELAENLGRKPFQLIADLMGLGVFANLNQSIDEGITARLCAKYGFKFEARKRDKAASPKPLIEKKVIETDSGDDPKHLKLRPPVVTIMGHVDHGKTTLLDAIRKTKVVEGEVGGITQHIGAYTVTIPHHTRKKEMYQITFLDTPGHAAFSAMRARGANVTDMVILVVAANDGVMPQTLEALSHAREAGAQIIVAVNKCDHPNANPQMARKQLQEHGLLCEEWGGEVQFVDLSALKNQGLDKLLDSVLVQAEVMELKANPTRRAQGNVIESGMDPGGPMATVLVRKGTLRVGDAIICGQHTGRVRAMIDADGNRLKEAGPSIAAKVLGLDGVPEAGDEFHAVEDEKAARELASEREAQSRKEFNEGRGTGVTLENLFATLDAESAKVLKVIIKADTQGSTEAIVSSLRSIKSEKVSMEVIHAAVGTITESDVNLASSGKAVVLGFHTKPDKGVQDSAKHHGVQIKLYKIIYELVDEVKAAMAGLLDPVLKEVVIGSADVRQLFTLSKGNTIAGCAVSSGRIARGKVRVMRRGKELHSGTVHTLRRFKENVDVVRAGMECGIGLSGFDTFEVGDVIESCVTEKVAQEL